MYPVYFAPMEGVTDAAFRKAHYACFTGVDAYYIPFISPTMHLCLNGREKHNVLPKYCEGVPCVPQVLTRESEYFLWAAGVMRDLGYGELNLNAGCPSATVTAKGKGSGILKDIASLDRFLEEIFSKSPLPISLKTRIGFDEPGEWERLLPVFSKYPFCRLIIHPRTCRESYRPGTLHPECFDMALNAGVKNLVFNGDLFTAGEVNTLAAATGEGVGFMLGRGLTANPALAREARGGEKLGKEELVRFHEVLSEEMQALYPPNIAFMKLRVVMKHLSCCFENAGKMEKQIRKSRSLPELLRVDRKLFEEYALKQEPAFIPDELNKGLSTHLTD